MLWWPIAADTYSRWVPRRNRGISAIGSTQRQLRGASRALSVVVSLTVAATIAVGAVPAHAATQVGFKDHSYAGFSAEASGGAITGQKPESKLWYDNGSWWAAMLSPAANGAHTIWRLGSSAWQDTGVVIDTRAYTKEDTLSFGTRLYILSRTDGSGSNQLRRFTYSNGAYSLDSGFPVNVPGAGKETAVLARDSQNKLWITYTSNNQVTVVHSLASDTSWGSAFVIPGTSNLSSDDISSVIAFDDGSGPAIGVFWSNQATQTDYFGVHRDGDPDTTWTVETALAGPKFADDHMNLKTFEGKVYAVVKTSQTGSNYPLIRLLVRSTSGSWSNNPVALVREGNTRPITMLQIDPAQRLIYVFMTQGEGTAARGILYKKSPIDGGIGFGSAVTFIQGPNSEVINDATSMKGNADASTGIVVVASDGNNYWWNQIGGGAPQNAPPVASAGSASTNEDTPVTVTLAGSDQETCNLTFSIVTQPAHGTLGSQSAQNCVSGTPNTDTSRVTFTPAANYNGSDSFTFKVNDGQVDSAVATVSLTVNAVNDVPTATAGSASTPHDTPVTVTVNGTDVETCELTFSVVTAPAHGTAGAPGGVACVPGTPNSDSATILYTPTPGYSGPDSFTFKTNDGTTDSPAATVSLTVTPPVNTVPTANATSASTAQDTPVTITVSGTDPETCELSFTVVNNPNHGSAGTPGAVACVPGSPNSDSATILYTPNSGYTGSDSFTFRVNDGTANSAQATVSITVVAGTVPTATGGSATTDEDTSATVTVGGTDPETCELTFTIVTAPVHGTAGTPGAVACVPGSPNSDSATILYTPAANYNGSDSFTYKVNDGTADSAPATVTLTVNAVNDRPVATGGSSTTTANTPVTVTLRGSDVDNCDLTFSVVDAPANGSVGTPTDVACAPGTPNTDTARIVYLPATDYTGSDSFTFKVSDGTADSTTVTVSLTVTPANTAPTANAGSASTAQGTPVTVTLSGSDAETCQLAFSVVAPASHGTLGSPTALACVAGSPNTDQAQILYTPTAGYSGPDSFTFKVNDGSLDSTAATVSITVTAAPPTIAYRTGSSAVNVTATSLVIPAPAGQVVGDVMLAVVSARGNPNFVAPAGWTLIRLDISGFTMRQGIWYKVVTASEPASYTWTWSGAQAAAGGIAEYGGVSTTNPVDAHSGLVSANATTKNIVAPSVTTTVAGDMIVGFFGDAQNTSITPPAGMTERFDVVSNAGTYPDNIEVSDSTQPTAGATGDRTATTPINAWNIGQLVALRPSGS